MFPKECSECAICLSDICDKPKISSYDIQCKHQFHENCIAKWWLISDKCPYCRSKIRLTQFSYFNSIL